MSNRRSTRAGIAVKSALLALALQGGAGCGGGSVPVLPIAPRSTPAADAGASLSDVGGGEPADERSGSEAAATSPGTAPDAEAPPITQPPQVPASDAGSDVSPGSSETAPDAQPMDPPIQPDRAAVTSSGCPADTATPRVLFDIPRAGDRSDDFFRLPYPNDIRWRNGKLALADFPRPPGLLFPNIIGKVADAIVAERIGFGANPVVTFRLSRAAQAGTVAAAAAGTLTRFVDITEGAPEYGQTVAHRLGGTTPGRYLCGHHLLVERADPTPLLPGHTYAAMLTGALQDQLGQAFARDTDFAVMLGSAAPGGVERHAAWQAYAPLRQYLGSVSATANQIIAAAVFTVDRIDAPVAALRAAVRSGAAPVITDLVRCGAGAVSACDDGRTTGCAAAPADAPFVEYQGRLSLPVFQQGTPPYADVGGGIVFDSKGRPTEARREPVCFSLTVPRGQAPAAGWPLVLYAHGTGGNFRGPLESGLADELGRGALGAGADAPMATLSFDGVLHGPRKGTSSRSTDELVYNVFNPIAARDNQLQAAADLFAFVRAVPALSAAEHPLDAAQIGVYGHSQGGNAAAVAAGYEPDLKVVVLSGTGGGIANSLLEKKKPVDAAVALSLILGEVVSDPRHPALQLLQQYFDRADPLNHGRRIAAAPMVAHVPRHLLHVYGSSDSYAPESTQWAFAVGAGLPVAHAVMPSDRLAPLLPVTAPVRANFKVGATSVTALEAQFRPSGYDGHFVSTQNPAARAAIRHFLGTYFRDATPELQ